MARPLRIEYPGAFYHVLNRGNNHSNIFDFQEDMDLFLDGVVSEAHERFGIKLIAFCLMPNHYHLLIYTPKPNLKEAMRHIGGVYTQRFNKIHKRDGHLFRGRYKAILVQEGEYLRNLIRYIHFNPVKAKLADDPINWRYSSHRHYLTSKSPYRFLDIAKAMALYGNSLKTYITEMRAGVDKITESCYAKKKLKLIFGSKAFQEKILEEKTPLDDETEFFNEINQKQISPKIFEAVSIVFASSVKEMILSKPGQRNIALPMLASLLRDQGSFSHKQIKKLLNMKSKKAVGMSILRIKNTMIRNREFSDLYQELKETCRHV